MTARNGADRPGRILYSVEEAAELLGVGRTFMFYLVATGEIESLKIGKLRKIPRDAIDTYIDKLRRSRDPIWPRLAPGHMTVMRRSPKDLSVQLTCTAR